MRLEYGEESPQFSLGRPVGSMLHITRRHACPLRWLGAFLLFLVILLRDEKPFSRLCIFTSIIVVCVGQQEGAQICVVSHSHVMQSKLVSPTKRTNPPPQGAPAPPFLSGNVCRAPSLSQTILTNAWGYVMPNGVTEHNHLATDHPHGRAGFLRAAGFIMAKMAPNGNIGGLG